MGTKTQEPAPASRSNGDLLDTWKEIAAYLKRDVRTVQRMEREGLPVYRHPTKKRANVYAYRSEVDAWWGATQGRASTIPVTEVAGTAESEPASDHRLRWLALAGAIVGVIAVGLWWVGMPVPREKGFHQSMVSTLRFGSAVVSPNGKWLAYADAETAHLHVRDLESGDERVLVPEWTRGNYVWSPDSEKLAYLAWESRQVETVHVRTGHRRTVKIPGGKRGFRQHTFTPDGRRLLGRFVTKDRPVEAAFVDVETGELSPLAVPAKTPSRLTVSPDGRFVTYRSRREGNSDIYLWPISGEGEEHRLTDYPDFESSEMWSPDSRYLFFMRRRPNKESSLWVVEISDSGSRVGRPYEVLPAGPISMAMIPSMSDSGDVYLGRKEGSEGQSLLLDVDPLTGEPRGEPYSVLPIGARTKGWSEDGSKIHYRTLATARQEGTITYFEHDLESGEERAQVIPLPPGHEVYHRTWPTAADRSYLFAARNPKEVLRYDIDNNEVTTVTAFDRPVKNFRATPRASYVSILIEPKNRNEFIMELVRLSDGRRRRLLTSRTEPWEDWSADGREMAYTDGSCLMVAPWEDGAPEELACASPSKLPQKGEYRPQSADYLWSGQNPSWSPDGTKIAWTVPIPETKRVELWIVDRETGEYTVAWRGAEDYVTMPRVVRWSPAGDKIAFDMWRYARVQVWALRNLMSPGPDGESVVSRVAGD